MRRLVAGALVVVLVASAAACSDDDDDAGSVEALCALVGDGRSHTQLFEGGFDPTDRERALAQLDAARLDLEELRAAAPGDLHDALDDELRYVEALVEAVETADPDDPAAVVAAVNGLDDERAAAETAALALARFEEERCAATTAPGATATSAVPPP